MDKIIRCITSDGAIMAACVDASDIVFTAKKIHHLSIDKLIFNLTGSKPKVAFAGKNINVVIQAVGTNGKKYNATIKGSNFATWQAPVGLNRIQFTAKSSDTTGGIILQPESGGVGISYIPLNAGANLESTSEPISDADVISRG